jgi:hypothetical protein
VLLLLSGVWYINEGVLVEKQQAVDALFAEHAALTGQSLSHAIPILNHKEVCSHPQFRQHRVCDVWWVLSTFAERWIVLMIATTLGYMAFLAYISRHQLRFVHEKWKDECNSCHYQDVRDRVEVLFCQSRRWHATALVRWQVVQTHLAAALPISSLADLAHSYCDCHI